MFLKFWHTLSDTYRYPATVVLKASSCFFDSLSVASAMPVSKDEIRAEESEYPSDFRHVPRSDAGGGKKKTQVHQP